MQIIGSKLCMRNLADCVGRGTILIQNWAVRDGAARRGFECGTAV